MKDRVSLMNQAERRMFLIISFLEERPELKDVVIPRDSIAQKHLLRGLMNVRQPGLPSQEVLRVQDEYLQQRITEEGITYFEDLVPVQPHIYLWQGDITTLACDAIVNAANSQMTGCWAPNHICIDNCIHTFAGVQLRCECAELMQKQGFLEPTGSAKITAAYNLPCRYVIHTVGPIVNGKLTEEHRAQLASNYRSCYCLAKEKGLQSLAFCCISTGVFGFPQEEAAKIAIGTVKELIENDNNPLDVIFNVFLDRDLELYAQLLA